MHIVLRHVLLIVFITSCGLCAERAIWIPPSEDLVGSGTTAVANGINDWHIQLQSDTLGSVTPAAWRVRGGLWYSMVDIGQWHFPYDKGFNVWNSYVAVKQSGARVDLFVDPLLAWPGDIFEVEAILPDSKMLTWKLISDGAQWLPGATWQGQGVTDRLGPKKTEGDGIRDWQITLDHPFAALAPARVDVWLPYSPIGNRLSRSGCFNYWSTDSGYAQTPALAEARDGALVVNINPVLATGGDEFFVRLVKPDKSWALWKVIGMGSDWEAGGAWYGQDDQDYTGMFESDKPNGVRDWHLRVAAPGLVAPVRWMVRGAKCIWESVEAGKKKTDFTTRALHPRVLGTSADLFFEPTMERAGDIFYVSAVLANGSVLNWGVMSLQQLRATDVTWRGQQTESDSGVRPAPTTDITPWQIDLQHEKLAHMQPYRWRITSGGKTWLFPRETDEEMKATEALAVRQAQGDVPAALFLPPFFVKPGTEFDVEAILPDGTLLQWTALADGAEWARAAEWRDSDGADLVGLSVKDGVDQRADWVLALADDKLAQQVTRITVDGCNWRWQWPSLDTVSPIALDHAGNRALLHITPVPGKKDDTGVLTITAVLQDGTVRYWQAIRPRVEKN
jgi:hypothetical protein